MIRPGSTLGILGGGQLGRMIAIAAAQLGLRVHVYAPEDNSPAFEVAAEHTVAAYDDEAALVRFAKAVDVITYEFENVPGATAATLSAHATLAPNARALAITQDRFEEKSFIADLGIPVAPFGLVSSPSELQDAVAAIGVPSVLKTRRFGYDGKGQAMIRPGDDPAAAWDALGRAPAILEGFVPFEREVSVVAARTRDGAFAAYDLCANEHRDHILALTRVPAGVSAETEAQAILIGRQIADALDYVGVLAVEMFLVREPGSERLVVNEIAPRVHNSGHWTLGGARTSQFEQHVRAVCGWPLGATERLGRVEMENLIGNDADRWEAFLAEPGAQLHLYGKAQARPGRKMGHVTRVFPEEA
ncbi:5-(carboxyamino)imidazole ribonucleotide synthase [Microvirga pudoricolor]|uniref:5-(carboxyamino)imidazole ribonucleotide synthase n=1 Tax=Microvirga pudoricolor TaxID=2778729 RepID=UPI00194DCE3E|nr:5-(carboxyamino)imidazole ribonucleotide synthase [Microvirga pudoricolor]MBM6594967.1 5-(carboxyamino)imidazole ribonucleotide synthase [Microvirga pudoricolor]